MRPPGRSLPMTGKDNWLMCKIKAHWQFFQFKLHETVQRVILLLCKVNSFPPNWHLTECGAVCEAAPGLTQPMWRGRWGKVMGRAWMARLELMDRRSPRCRACSADLTALIPAWQECCYLSHYHSQSWAQMSSLQMKFSISQYGSSLSPCKGAELHSILEAGVNF